MADAGAAAGGSKLPESPFFKEPEKGNKRGIPEAIFIDDVDKLCEGQDPTIQVAKLQELYNKYMYMQSSILAQRSALKTKLPDITQALEVVNHVVEKRDKASEGDATEYTYQLAENIWAKAKAPPSNSVCLWLGANCMLEYSVEEAVELLETNKTNAQTTLKALEEDHHFLRDQITTTEVNIARCHNLGVKQRQLAKELEEAKGEKAKAIEGEKAAVGGIGGKFAPAAREGAAKGNYTWKQESEEVEVSVPMPKGTTKSNVKVTILAESIKVEADGKVVLEGTLAGKCSTSGSTWTMAGSRVEITLVKAESIQWPALFEA
mmetsp:Transcript_20933/g.62419  ORF Transcript_20933/g.62419 Transcript_20933/m.62419 type:complete len:320 (-) Transcript_20933:121-1080(-)